MLIRFKRYISILASPRSSTGESGKKGVLIEAFDSTNASAHSSRRRAEDTRSHFPQCMQHRLGWRGYVTSIP